MKVKEIDRTANVAWSPQAQVPSVLWSEHCGLCTVQVPVYLAAGTAAQQLDASFSTNSNLEIYSLNLSESGHEMPCVASLPVEQRYHKVINSSGLISGALRNAGFESLIAPTKPSEARCGALNLGDNNPLHFSGQV